MRESVVRWFLIWCVAAVLAAALLPKSGFAQAGPDATEAAASEAAADDDGGGSGGVTVESLPSPPPFIAAPRPVPGREVAAQAGTAVLNFHEAGLRDILRTMAELTGENFIVAPGVTARISVQTVRPVPKDELLGILETILEVNGLAVVRSGKYYKIVAAAGARQHPGAVANGAEAGAAGLGAGMTSLVVPLEFIAAPDLLAVLKPMLSAAGNASALPRSNTVILTDSSPGLKSHVEVIRSLDVDAFERVSISMVQVRNVDVILLHKELSDILAALGLGKDAPQLAVVPIERLNSLVIFSSGKELASSVSEWVANLDVPASSESSSTRIYYVRNDKASNIKGILDQVYGDGAPVAAVSPAGSPAQGSSARREATAGPGERVRIFIYEPANALIIQASQGDYQRVLGTIRELDRPPRQVLIEALIAEVKLDESTRFGIQWSLLTGNVNIQQNTGLLSSALADPRSAIPTPIGAAAPSGLSVLATDASRFFAAIQALASEGKVDVLSNPHVVVKNYEKASINVGSDEPVSTQSAQTEVTGTSGIIQNIEYRKTGVILTVVPHITEGGMVAMSIRQEVSDKSTDRTIGNATYPSFTKREAETSVVAKDRETLVIGGLIQERFDSSSSGIPLLSRIPLIGNLFKFNSSARSKTELVILLKPTVISGPEEASAATREFREKLPAIKRQLREGGQE